MRFKIIKSTQERFNGTTFNWDMDHNIIYIRDKYGVEMKLKTERIISKGNIIKIMDSNNSIIVKNL